MTLNVIKMHDVCHGTVNQAKVIRILLYSSKISFHFCVDVNMA